MTMRNSLSRAFTFLCVLIVFAPLAGASDPPWKGKPYQQWDDKDIERVFTDSPWARTTTVTRTWLPLTEDRKSTRLNSSHRCISYAVFCLKKKKKKIKINILKITK